MAKWFWELRSFCDDHDKAITPASIIAYFECLGGLPSVWEKSTLLAMDRQFRVALSEEIAENEEKWAKSEARKAKK